MALLMRITPNTLPAEEQPQITVEKEEEEVADMPTEIQLSTVRKVVKRRKSKKAPAPSSRKSSTASVANQRKSSSSTVKSVAASGTKASSRKSSTVIDGVKKPGGTSRKSLADSKISGSSRLLAQTTASSRRSSDIISVASRNSGSVASSVFHSHQPKKQAVFPKSIVSLGDALPPLSTSMPPSKHAW
jgi:type IV secretory pathway VirB10-like protein